LDPRADPDRRDLVTPSLPGLDIIIPVFNEGPAIRRVYEHLAKALDTHVSWRAFFVYDFPQDTTLPILEELAQKDKRVIPTLQTYGKGVVNALKFGFHATHDGPVAVVMGDDSDDLEQLPAMLQLYEQHQAAVVACSRYSRGGAYLGGSWLKKHLSRLAGRLLHFGGVNTSDPTNNFKLYRNSFLRQVSVESRGGFEIALELTLKATMLRLPVCEVPGTWSDRVEGVSKFRLFKWMPHYLSWFNRYWWWKLAG